MTRALLVAAALVSMAASALAGDALPDRARQYIPILKEEQARLWPDMPLPTALAAQVEQETCPSLKHRQCWNTRAELLTSRERGVGLGQITKTERFDALAGVRSANMRELADWTWANDSIYDPRLQLRALVLMDLAAWKYTQGAANPTERLKFALTAYNGGIGGVASDRKVCQATPGCDPSRWTGHVEHTSLKAKKPVSGYGLSFFDINRAYSRNILGFRLTHYQGLL